MKITSDSKIQFLLLLTFQKMSYLGQYIQTDNLCLIQHKRMIFLKK